MDGGGVTEKKAAKPVTAVQAMDIFDKGPQCFSICKHDIVFASSET